MTRANQRQLQRDAIRLAAAIRGCVCDPPIRHPKHKPKGLVFDVSLYHSEECPAYGTRPQLILLPSGHR